jgi:precorrin-8X/cobalt-precorrin-8 methylmutase
LAFDRTIGVDWSGAGSDDASIRGLAAAVGTGSAVETVNWQRRSRRAVTEWLIEQLRSDAPRTLVGLDFAFGYPEGAMSVVFEAAQWAELPRRMGRLLDAHGTAQAVAAHINGSTRFAGHGPFRTNANRCDFRFYLDHGISYLRHVETIVPQAISQWYLGSGATVGYSTITGLAALDRMLCARDAGRCDFSIWPFEAVRSDAHVIAEVYPAIWPKPEGYQGGEHDRDAIRVAAGLWALPNDLSLPTNHLPPGCLIEEGWMLGVS